MSPPRVYVECAAQASASGRGLAEAVERVLTGQVSCGARQVAGTNWPYLAIDWPEPDPARRAQQIVREVAAELRAGPALDAAAWAEAGLFIGSSSFQAGAIETAIRDGSEARPRVGDFAQQIAAWLGIETTPWCFSSACTSSLAALAAATTLIEGGVLKHALVLGVELANDTTLAGFAALELLSDTACRPLDAQRKGMVLGEAVAALWLSRQAPRGARPRWRVAGWDLAVDGASPTGPQRDGVALAAVLERALARAGCGAEAIGAVKMHAAGSGDADAAEAAALLRVFGQCLPPLVSFKPYLGHTLGASGALETALLLGCLAQAALPATPGFMHPDPALGIAPTLTRCPSAADRVLLNFIGFGGSLAALVLERE